MAGKVIKELNLDGLDCANCAAKIEAKVKQLEGVEAASMNFITKTLSLNIADADQLETVIEETKSIVNRLEPHVVVSEKTVKSNEEEEHEKDKTEFIRLAVGIGLYTVALLFRFNTTIEFSLFFIAYILVGGEVLLKSAKDILRGQVFDENFLMSVATIGAFAVGAFPEGVAVMLFYQIGEFFQDMAVNRSRKSIKALMDIRPDFAYLKTGNGLEKVTPEEVNIGDIIVVKPGDKVPLDGKITEGASMLDTSALTGESVPREVFAGDEILAGFINKSGVLTVKVTKEFGESTVSKILDLVQNASSKKAPTENFITKFARYYTPAVVFVALALAVIPPLVIHGALFSDWIYRALVFLVVSCPCALVVSIPLGFFGGIGGASKNGILIKGSNYLEALNSVETVVFDKTGTLTKGVFKVTAINAVNDNTDEELLKLAAFAESYSNHPIAASIMKAYGNEIDQSWIESHEEISGYGIKAKVFGKEILAGNTKLMESENIAYEPVDDIGTAVYVAVDKQFTGHIVISDEVKADSKHAISELKSIGIKKTVMLTGDLKAVGQKVGSMLGIDEVYADLLPDQKVERLEELEMKKASKGKLVFVGDGINDAPVLARADIGIAMGGLGSDAAIEAADIVIMTDEPSKIVTAIRVAKRTKSIVWQNIWFAFAVKLAVLALGAGGLATMWEAVFADVGVALIAVLNAMRVMNTKYI